MTPVAAVARRVPVAGAVAVLVASALAAVALVAVDAPGGIGRTLLGVVVGVSLLLDVEVPSGGQVPVGHAVVIAVVGTLPSHEAAFAVALGLLVCAPVLTRRSGTGRTGLAVAGRRLAGFAACALVAGAVVAAVRGAGADGGSPRMALAHLLVAGTAYLGVDVLATQVRGGRGRWSRVRKALPLHATILCAAALLGLAADEGWVAITAAVLPLLATRFSFERYSRARRTYGQTIQALGIVPELASFAPVGHGERTAAYAVALSRMLGGMGGGEDEVATAARLHHIGHIALPDDDGHDRRRVAAAGAGILRETGVLAGVAHLVDATGHDQGPRPLAAAVVRIACEFDSLVAEDPTRAPDAVDVLERQRRAPADGRVLAALRRLVETQPDVVAASAVSGAELTRVALAARTAAR